MTWWFTKSETKRVAVELFYMNKLIDLAVGKNAVDAASTDEMISVLTKLQQLVIDGTLDSQIEAAADSVKARFKK